MSRRYRGGFITANTPALGNPSPGIWTADQQFSARGQGLWPTLPSTPTIGTATAGTCLCASVTFTASTSTGYPTTLTYTITSTPGNITATGAASPIKVTGLTSGTSYTFKVKAANGAGTTPCSSASNSITAVQATCAVYTTPGTYSWTAPTGVTSVAAVAIGGGASAYNMSGGGGGLGWRNNIAVTPGTSYTVVVGAAGGTSYFISTATVRGIGACGVFGGGYTGDGGGNGGTAVANWNAGGAGAGGYSGPGGNGAGQGGNGGNGCSFGGGAGGGGGAIVNCYCGYLCIAWSGNGGGTALYGKGTSGAGGSAANNGGTGSPVAGKGAYGGGAGSSPNCQATTRPGQSGAVRIVWAGGSRGTPSFPSTNVGP